MRTQMDLSSSLSIATSGLHAIDYQLSVVSQNVANQSVSGYVSESATVVSRTPGGLRAGVVAGSTVLNVNKALQASLYNQNAKVAESDALSNSLSAITSIQGSTDTDTTTSTGSSNSLPDSLGNIQSTLTSLAATPLESSAQTAVISAAKTLTSNIHTLSDAYTAQRQTAQDNIVSTVSTVNSQLTQIGSLSAQIMSLKASGADSADLENQRLEAMNSLSSNLSVTFSESSNGDMVVRTEDGTELPTRPDQMGKPYNSIKLPTSTWPLSASNTTLSASTVYSSDTSTANPDLFISLDGTGDIKSHLTGGTLGANITLRDTTYPKMQAQLDSFSYTLISRFSNAGVSLFTNGSTSTPSSNPTGTTPNGLVGLSSALSVDSEYTADPSKLSSGGDTSTTKGDISAITNVLNETFGTSSADTTGSLAAPSSGLGPDGSISLGFSGSQGILALATSLTSDQASVASEASNGFTYASSVQTTLQTAVSSVSGVNVNNEMAKVVALQNAYTANAKVISTVQTMFSALLNAIN
ncbi:flagellar hook-associated protein FlgK [Acetobacter orientalis]|nr:flagellar hook-associated protein FlgK [Acetobacter orientalis]